MASLPRLRHLLRSLRRLNLTILCGVLTILTLRGTLGAGKFGTPNQDFHHLRHHFRRLPLRVLTELPHRHDAAIRSDDDDDGATPLENSGGGRAASSHRPVSIDAGGGGGQRKESASAALLLRGGDSALEEEAAAAPPGIMLIFDARAGGGSRCAEDEEEEEEEEDLLHESIKNKVDYCRIHGMDMFYGIGRASSDLPAFLSHTLTPPENATESSGAAAGRGAVQRQMKRLMATHADVEWFWWMDFDAVFTNMSLELPTSKYDGYNAVLFRRPAPYVNGSSSNSLLLRNCEWSVDILERWAAGEEVEESQARGKVMVESSEEILQGWWVSEEEQIRPLLTDFRNCSNEKECRKQKITALELAEEQVLIWYGIESGGRLRQNHHSLA